MIGFLFSGARIEGIPSNLTLLIARVGTGLSMAFAHGLNKIPPSDGFVGAVDKMGFPLPLLFAWGAALSEFVGGILLALGLATRGAAIAIGITMLVAAFITHAADPFAKKEMALLYLYLSVLFAGTGGGRYSIDAKITPR